MGSDFAVPDAARDNPLPTLATSIFHFASLVSVEISKKPRRFSRPFAPALSRTGASSLLFQQLLT